MRRCANASAQPKRENLRWSARRLLKLAARRHFLHAAWLRFRHPTTGEMMDLRSPLPPDLRESLSAAADDPGLATDADPLARFGFFDEPKASP